MSAILDTGFLLAVLDADDKWHESCANALLAETKPLLPDMVLPELAYMILREPGNEVLINFLLSVTKGEIILERMKQRDLARSCEILEKYKDQHVDFVDCVIVAIAERLNVQRILTVDHRHFKLFRPHHCRYFKIIP